MQYKFRFGLFGKRVRMFREGERGIVVEKEPQVICVYGTDQDYNILCAIPLYHPKLLKGAEYTVEVDEKNRAKLCVGDLRIVIDYSQRKCTNNKSIRCYGSDRWGQDVSMEWSELLFNEAEESKRRQT